MKTKCNLFQLCLLGAVLLQAATSGAQPVITSQPVNQPVVWGGNATFSVMATGVGPLTYQWQLNGTNLPNNIVSTVAGGNLFNNQPATNTILSSAASVITDNVGNLIIADYGNHVIRKVATNAGLFFPINVILDSVGNLLIADSSNNRIRKVDTNGVITTVAGNGTTPNFLNPQVGEDGGDTNAEI